MYFSDVLEEEKEEARAIGLAEGRATGLAEGRAEGRASGLAEGRAEGRAEGVLEGEKLKAIETAKKMLAENCDIDFINKITDLSKEQILELQ